jgi:hypothetical protein
MGDPQVYEDEWAARGLDTDTPNIARVYDYLIGGKDNFAADRQVAQMALRIAPDGPKTARANRQFLKGVVRYLAAEVGLRQFLDIGSGLPSHGNVHEVAQQVDPGIRVVYVDNDPVVLVHGRAMLATNPHTTVIQADIRQPDDILNRPEVREFIDFSQPVGLLLLAILHHVNDDEDPAGIAARLCGELAAGSYLAISHFLNPGAEHPEVARQAAAGEKLFNEHLGTGRWRTRKEILEYFGDLELLKPGLVPLPLWRPPTVPDDIPLLGQGATLDPIHHSFAGGLARKH